jgi:polysaccharide chain length determinant protein (PEP-CTERM system associated)
MRGLPDEAGRIEPRQPRRPGLEISMDEAMHEERHLGLQDILAIARRRWIWIAVPLVLGPIVGYLISLRITPVFTSQAFVLVEQQKVPDTFVPSMVTDQLEARLLTLQDQILSRSRLELLIEQFGLYKSDLRRLSMDELVARLKKDIKVTLLRPDSTTTLRGFYVAVDADSPGTAQKVCAQVLSMFMEENLNARSKRAQDTTEFLAGQLDDAKRRLDENDAKLADFKTKYMGRLPTDEQGNLQMLATLSSRLDSVNEAIAQAQQQKVTQSSLLAQHLGSAGGARLPVAKASDLEKQLSDLRAQLTALETQYTPDHPDVVAVKGQIASLQQQLRSASASAPQPAAVSTAELPDDAETAQLRASLLALDESIKIKRAEQARLEQQISSFQARIQLSPQVEEQFKGLTRDYESSLQFYNDLSTKKTQAEMVRDLEQRREGEQFRVMDAPALPTNPSWPNRQKFALAGLAAGFALGAFCAGVLEFKERLIRTERDVEAHLGLPILVVIPNLDSR